MSKDIARYKSKKKYFMKKSFQRKLSLDVNLKGFLCSCNNREKDCIREAYNLLNEYADKLYPSPEGEVDDEEDIGDSLTKEISQLDAKPAEKRFQVIESGAKNFLFIRTNLDNPTELAEAIVKDVHANGQQKTRFLLRLVPVEVTCKASLEDIEKAFDSLLDRHFKDSPQTFCVIFNHRNNNAVSRDSVIKSIAAKVLLIRSDHKVDLKGANICVIVEVIKGFAFLSVVPNYLQYKKFNLLSVCGSDQKAEDPVN